MRRFLHIIIFIAASVLRVEAQVETQGSQVEGLEADSAVLNLRKELLENPVENPLGIQPTSPEFSLEKPSVSATGIVSPSLNYDGNKLPLMCWNGIPKDWLPALPHWSSGYVTGYNGMVVSPLSGGTNYAGAAIVQSFGRYLTASVGTEVSKTFYYSSVFNHATFNGTLQFRPNQNFGVTVFGTYSPGTFLTNSPQIGAAWQYGGYISLESDNHWGIDLGASQSYDHFSGHNVTPIVKPYYNLNGAKLGIDFGPLIQGLLHKHGHGGGPVEFSPTGPRPMKNLPTVAPRR